MPALLFRASILAFGRQSMSSMSEMKCLTLTALAVTSQTSVVRLMTLSILVLPSINSAPDHFTVFAPAFYTL